MAQRKVAALLIEPGSSLEYFTGIRWHRSERSTVAIIPAAGQVLVVTPAFEEPSVRETLQVGGDVRPWDEHENPFEKIVQGLKERGINSGVLAAESTMRFFIVAGIRQASNAYEIIPADPIVRACRLIKSPAELALMQLANDVTIEALRQVHGQVALGMSGPTSARLMDHATISLGGSPAFSLVLLNDASAYPHGSVKPQKHPRGLGDSHGLRLRGARLRIRHLEDLGVWAAERPATQSLGYRQARPGTCVGERQNQCSRRLHRRCGAQVL